MFFLEQKRLTLVYPDTGLSGYLALCLHRAETSGTGLSGHWFVRNTSLSGQLQGGSGFFLEQNRWHWFVRTLVCPDSFKGAIGSVLSRNV